MAASNRFDQCPLIFSHDWLLLFCFGLRNSAVGEQRPGTAAKRFELGIMMRCDAVFRPHGEWPPFASIFYIWGFGYSNGGNFPPLKTIWCRLQDSNPWPPDYKSDALPTELSRHRDAPIALNWSKGPARYCKEGKFSHFMAIFLRLLARNGCGGGWTYPQIKRAEPKPRPIFIRPN